MFNRDVLTELYEHETAQLVFPKLVRLEDAMNAQIYDAAIPIKALILALATQRSVLFDGPPGVAKSMMARRVCELIGVTPPDGESASEFAERPLARVDRGDYFEYLLSPFTEPTELFGAFRLEGLAGGAGWLERYDRRMIHRCRVVFLDEVFNASSAILNALLALMNERLFHDRGEVLKADLRLLLAATNEELPPRDSRLRAVYDRFVFRCKVPATEARPETLSGLIDTAWRRRDPRDAELDGLLEDVDVFLGVFRSRLPKLWAPSVDDGALESLSYIVRYAQRQELGTFSNRRVRQLCEALAIHRIYRAYREGGIGLATMQRPDFEIAWRYFLDVTDRLQEDHIAHFDSIFDSEGAA